MSAVFVLILLGAMVVLLAFEWIRPDLVAMLGLVGLILAGMLSPGEALLGFSNPATVTVASMFLLSAGLQESGVVRLIGDRILRHGPDSPAGLTLLIGLVIGPISAFINNTAAVAVFLPIALRVCQEHRISPSRVLMPMSFFAMLGGTCTLIGTSTNVLVSTYAAQHGIRPFGMFEFSLLGLVLFAAGAVFLIVAGGRMVPDRVTPDSLTGGYRLNPYLSEVVILPGSPLIGRTLREARLGERHDLEVLGLYRNKRMLGIPGEDTRLAEGDILIVKVPASALVQLRDSMGIAAKHGRHPDDADLHSADSVLIEVVVSPNSALEGQTLKSIDFRRRYGATALAVRRHGEDIGDKVGRIRLAFGDELLILARRATLDRLRNQTDFVVLQELDVPMVRRPHAIAAVAIVAGVVVAATTGYLPIAEAAMIGSVAMIVGGCLPLRKAYTSVDWRIVFLLACLIPVGTALERSGGADLVVDGVLRVAESWGPTVVLGAFFVVTTLLTGVLSNNATALLLAPLAVSTAAGLGVDPRPFLVAVTFAASAAFYTPIGYQTNLLVYGPGGYRFADYVRLGGPLVAIVVVLATLLIPVLFPF